tara:strand:+ start:382 stop:483 length:102 start_codon:yes stop_codon:yes gene_type:complete
MAMVVMLGTLMGIKVITCIATGVGEDILMDISI